MHKKQWLVIGIAVLSTACTKDAKSILGSAQSAMGNPKSIQYSGTGMNAFFGQALTAGHEWPRRDLESFSAAVNYAQKSARLQLVFKEEVFGGRQQNFEVNGDRAWTVGVNGANPQLAAAEERQLQIWMTPHGFLRAALASGDATARAQTENGHKVNVVSFTAMGKFK